MALLLAGGMTLLDLKSCLSDSISVAGKFRLDKFSNTPYYSLVYQ